ncbi:hypothetical protein BXZ70DRAFT_889187 [Cristinia sonorae]|uniref:Uncharacterized protein n=1 Tax=Cristinia sonorae TaxID=1940300 RepID=A0A8K0UUI2_9AGAR|nr:hypothetical protein BXZ70DRAFT_889187 [Cristinia sonorae]
MYPASPLLSFPPPAPATGRTLAERAGITLTVKTTFTTSEGKRASVKNVQPHRNHLPRRRNPKRMRSIQPTPLSLAERYPEFAVQVQVISQGGYPAEQILERKPEETHDLQELIPGLYLAFFDGDSSGEQPKLDDPNKPWTHIVNIVYPSESAEESLKGSSEQSYKDGVQYLRLTLPTSTRAQLQSSARTGLGLTDAHLRTVRDFIAQALPSHIAALPDQRDIRVLVTAPHGRPTDAMCAASCYLSFASGRDVVEVLRFVDEEEDFLSVWKGEVSENECERTQKIAKAWSWLSQIARPLGV